MLIVLEGPDGSGKTTAVRKLTQRGALRGATVLHFGPIEKDPLEEYELALQWYRPGTRQHVICDRLHLGERVYGPLLRGESKLDDARLLHIHLFLQSRGAVVIIMRERLDVIRFRLETRGDDLIKQKNLADIIADYRLLALTGWSDHQSTPLDLADVYDFARYRDKMCAPLVDFPTYVGGFRPSALLLGDTRNSPAEYESAFVPFNATSGHFLLEALTPSFGQRIGIANACEENVEQLWKILECPPVVCLGRNAQRVAKLNNVPHSTVPHPQYVRRFHHKMKRRYGELIQALAQRRAEIDLGGWPR